MDNYDGLYFRELNHLMIKTLMLNNDIPKMRKLLFIIKTRCHLHFKIHVFCECRNQIDAPLSTLYKRY